LYIERSVSLESALIAGLLHNIGQYWFFAYAAGDYRECIDAAMQEAIPLEVAERRRFGVDHAQIGAWLLAHWQLPTNICEAVNGHRAPEVHPGNVLVALTHVAEVISDALDLAHSRESRVTHVSAAACNLLGLVWNADVHALFGRIEARSRHANAFFDATSGALPT
jgi:HD-like signal output (HDOD) protein